MGGKGNHITELGGQLVHLTPEGHFQYGDISIPSSPISHLRGAVSRSGPYIPSVRQTIAEAEWKMQKIDREMIRLLQQKEALREYRDRHIPYLQLSPIIRLPVELLASIFLLCHRQTTPKTVTLGVPLDQADSFSSVSTPILLSHVCSSWRSVIHSTPHLWTRITLNTANRPIKSRLDFLNMWIEWSKPLPLSVHIINVLRDTSSPRLADAVIERLLSVSERWEALHLTTPSPDSWNLFAGIKSRVPILRTCIITEAWSQNQFQGMALAPPPELLQFTPQLRTVKMQKGPLFSAMTLPFHQLTEVDLVMEPYTSVALSLEECLKILRTCLKLKKCSLYCEGQKWATFSENNAVQLVHNELQDIFLLSEGDGEVLCMFFKQLSCPSLRRLYAKSRRYSQAESCWNQYDSFSDFLRWTCGSLESLHLIVMEVGGEDFINHLQLTPKLRELELRINEQSGEKVVCHLKAHALPNLSDLRYLRRPNNFSKIFSQVIIASARLLTEDETKTSKPL